MKEMMAARGYAINLISIPLATVRIEARNKATRCQLSQAAFKLWGSTEARWEGEKTCTGCTVQR